jgi:hypothetical protein
MLPDNHKSLQRNFYFSFIGRDDQSKCKYVSEEITIKFNGEENDSELFEIITE